jgi:hypothetical protein
VRSRGVAESTAEVLRLIDEMRSGRAPTRPAAAPMRPAAQRLEVERWREAFYCDAVADRLASICALLEERVDALEEELAAPRPPRPAMAVGPPAATAPAAPLAPAPRAAPAAAGPAPGEPALLSGQIQEGVLSDVLQMLSANQKTGRFVIEGPGGAMQLWYHEGEIRHAAAGELTGEDAFFAAISQPSGGFYFIESTEAPPAQTINNKTQFLILEGLRKMDEEGLTGEPPESEEHPS